MARALTALRGTVALVAGALLLRWLVEVTASVVRIGVVGAPLRGDEALGGLAAGAAALALSWVLLGLVLEVVGLAPGIVGDAARTASAILTPRLLRRSVGLVLGVGVVAGLAPGASVAAAPVSRVLVAATPLPDPGFAPLPDPGWSAPTEPPGTATRSEVTSTVPTQLSSRTSTSTPTPTPMRSAPSAPSDPTPTRSSPGPHWVPPAPTVRPQPDVRLLGPTPASAEPGEVVVRRGDTLWAIASRHLGPHPSDAEIAQAWPAWHDANRHVIGDDPDLLLPGQVLRSPRAVAS